jgi:hypothetical protein
MRLLGVSYDDTPRLRRHHTPMRRRLRFRVPLATRLARNRVYEGEGLFGVPAKITHIIHGNHAFQSLFIGGGHPDNTVSQRLG